MDETEIREIIAAIRDVYNDRALTVGDMFGILHECGYNKKQASNIIRQALSCKMIGRVTYKAVKSNMPSKNTVLYLKAKEKGDKST